MNLKGIISLFKEVSNDIKKEAFVMKSVAIALRDYKRENDGKNPEKIILSSSFSVDVERALKPQICPIKSQVLVSVYPQKTLFNIPVFVDENSTMDVRIE